MRCNRDHLRFLLPVLWLVLVAAWGAGCSSTSSLKDGQYLLRSNRVRITDKQPIPDRSVLTENLNRLVIQQPNSRILGLPVKLYLYNLRRNRYETDSLNYQLKSRTAERPVVFDSSLMRHSRQAMSAYLFNAGFFYARVADSVKLEDQKAYVTYQVQTGDYYTLNSNEIDVEDSAIRQILFTENGETLLRKGVPFSMMLLEEERSRIATLVRNKGYYLFSSDNVSFEIDTLHPAAPPVIRDSLGIALNTDSQTVLPASEKHLSVRTIIRPGADTNTFKVFRIGRIRVYPDFADRRDYRDSTLIKTTLKDVEFRYHKRYLKEDVIYRNIYFSQGSLFSQLDYDQTITRLNDLGVFQSVRISLNEDTLVTDQKLLRVNIYMNPTARYDFNTNFEVLSASTYTLGSAVGFGIRNRNFLRGANQLSLNVSTGIELLYDQTLSDQFTKRFFTRSRNIGVSTSLSMPRFLAPFRLPRITKGSLPRTVINIGTTYLDRTDYFRLINSTASFTYNWQQTHSRLWEFSPLFVSVFQLPYTSESFRQRLDTNLFLANSYREVTIAGENLSYTFSNNEARRGRNYSYLRISAEEAGGILKALTSISGALSNRISDRYAQYLRFDADARHYLTGPKNTLALRIAAGVGIPYGRSRTLPYVKQYFAGGPYSVRGWRVRTLGPGAYHNPTDAERSYQIDRTGDIRLEGNIEYRLSLFNLLAGAVKVGGAAFADAGNIWLAQADSSYPGGEFQLRKVPQDLALSTGLGVRLNFGDLITLRVDGAIPVKKPGLSDEGGGWIIDDIRLRDPLWRRDNLVLSFAIGYPF